MTEASRLAAPEREATGSPGIYAERTARFDAVAAAISARSRLLSNFRGLAFGTAAITLVVGTLGDHDPSLTVSPLAFILFVGLVVHHGRVIAAEDDALRLASVNRDAAARASGDFRSLPEDGARFASDAHAYSSDLDLFGPGSLFQRLGVARTRFGQEALAEFLRGPASIPTIQSRQEAVRELSPRLEERQRLEAQAMAVVPPGSPPGAGGRTRPPAGAPPDPEPLLSWAEGAPVLSGQTLVVALAFALPPLTLGLLAFAGALGLPGYSWAFPFVGQLYVMTRARGEAERVFSAVSATQGAFLRYGPIFELVEGLEVHAPLVRRLREGLVASAVRPSAAMRDFERIVSWFELRHNGLVHPFANAFLLWDLHSVLRLERWQGRAGRGARSWFRALGEVEALSALAALAHDEPEFCFAEVTEGPAHFRAEGLGHPLLRREVRVTNDVRIDEPGHAWLVTGSNMSGKSTFLRSIGIGTVLALAGGPVPARRLSLSPLAVRTSIRIADSLASGVSHFYAEVARLKGVLEATRGPLPVLFLLDEVLHGTNSEERKTGARWVLRELLERGAIGLVSTHDQGLCELPESLMTRVQQCNFRETVDGGAMSFDYRLRPGPVSGGNALRLMRLVGLDVPLPEA